MGKECAWCMGAGKCSCQRKIVPHAQCSWGKLLATGAGAPCQACSQTCQTSCQTLNQECSCCPGGSQACSWRAHSCKYSCQKSGTQSQFLSRAEHASQQAVPGSFVVHMASCLHVLFRVARPLHSNRGCEGTVMWGTFPGGWRGYRRAQPLIMQGGGGRHHTDLWDNCSTGLL